MKNPYLLALFSLFLFYSCKKSEQASLAKENLNKLNLKSTVNALSTAYPTASNDNDSVETPTVIDYQLPNPYLIPNMQQAYYNIRGQNTTPAVTNLYVRLKPSDLDQLKTLDSVAEAQNLELFDEPLDYHVVQEGDYYQDPSVPMEEITWQYTVVPPNFQPPSGIQYEVLASIHIPTDMAVEAEAERLVGLNSDGDDYAGGSGGSAAPAGKASSNMNTATGKQVQPNVSSCLPGYHWDATRKICVEDPPPVYYSIPGGTIRVWDTQIDGPQLPANSLDPSSRAQPVRTARVVARRWFKIDRSYTDNSGIFHVTSNFRNKVKLLVKFRNQYASVRGIRGVRMWQMLFPIKKKIGVFTNSSINTVNYTFLQTSDINSAGNRWWAGATTLNAVQEHRDYCGQFGINAPPVDLNIFLSNWGKIEGLASTPLFNKRFLRDLPNSFINTVLVDFTAHAIPGGLSTLTALFARTNVDMAVGYHTSDMSVFTSDWIKETLYHELSHASHYSRVGTVWYTSFVNAELHEIASYPDPNDPLNPYGPATSSDAPIIALGEGWAYHMGHFLTDQRYGTHSANTFSQGFKYTNGEIWSGGVLVANTGLNAHINLLEDFDPNRRSQDPIWWIPKGLMWDLMDDRNDVLATPLRVNINDQVSGFTIQQLFNALQPDVTALQQYKARLQQQNPNYQTVEITNLFEDYGY